MKNRTRLFFVLLLLTETSFGQKSYDTSYSQKEFFVGFNIGLLLSNFIPGSDNNETSPGVSTTWDVTYENSPTPGLSFGASLEFYYARHFSIRTDLNYNLTNHHIVYEKKSSGFSSSVSHADYKIRCSAITLSVLPKFLIGHNRRFYFLLGPYFDVTTFSSTKGQNTEINNRTKSTVGPCAGVGISIPVKKSLFCFETKCSYGLNEVLHSPNLRQLNFGLCFIYQLGID